MLWEWSRIRAGQRVSADLDYLNMQGVVDNIVTSEDTVERKPHPAPLLKGAEKLGLRPAECAYIGDYEGDIIAAKAAGMVSVAALWGGMFLAEALLKGGAGLYGGDT